MSRDSRRVTLPYTSQILENMKAYYLIYLWSLIQDETIE